MSCGICSGLLSPCPVCHTYGTPYIPAEPFEQRLDARRHMGSHETVYQANIEPAPAAAGVYSIDMPDSDRVGPKYSRDFNNKYSGPGRGTW